MDGQKEPVDKVNDFVRARLREEAFKAKVRRMLTSPWESFPEELDFLFTPESVAASKEHCAKMKAEREKIFGPDEEDIQLR